MTKLIFNPDSVSTAVEEMDTFRNDVIGAAAFFAGLTALQFPLDHERYSVGTVAFFFIFFWATMKVRKYKDEHRRFYAAHGEWKGTLLTLWNNSVMVVGIVFLGSVATGYVTLETIRPLGKLARLFHS